jgi:hypothetical protein
MYASIERTFGVKAQHRVERSCGRYFAFTDKLDVKGKAYAVRVRPPRSHENVGLSGKTSRKESPPSYPVATTPKLRGQTIVPPGVQYSALLPMLNARRIVLPRHDRLVNSE